MLISANLFYHIVVFNSHPKALARPLELTPQQKTFNQLTNAPLVFSYIFVHFNLCTYLLDELTGHYLTRSTHTTVKLTASRYLPDGS